MLTDTLSTNEQRIVAYVERACLNGPGVRTTEVRYIADNVGLLPQEVADLIVDLVKREHLKCATETWQDYCWILTPAIPMPPHLVSTTPFGL